MEEPRNPRARHTFTAILALVTGGLFAWVIQLARQGDPVGYIILTGSGILFALLVSGIVLRLVIVAINQPSRQHAGDLKTIYETQRVLAQQNRALLNRLKQMQKQPALLAGRIKDQNEVELQPGQIMTAEGFIIDGTAFDVLDEEENS